MECYQTGYIVFSSSIVKKKESHPFKGLNCYNKYYFFSLSLVQSKWVRHSGIC